jgi:membrane-associated phospholipid phosphatase
MTTDLDTESRRSVFEGRVARFHPAAVVAAVAIGGYVVICLVLSGIGLLVTHDLGGLTRWDERTNKWFADNRTSAMNNWTDHATKVADTSGILVVLVLAIIVLLLFRRRWDALFLVIALSLELVAFLSINTLVGRPRPNVERLGALPSTSSYPSGHVAATLALYGGLTLIVSARIRSRIAAAVGWFVAILLASAIGLARVYRGMHHPSDVVAGALLGFAVLAVAVAAVRAGQKAAAQRRRRRTSTPDHAGDPTFETRVGRQPSLETTTSSP